MNALRQAFRVLFFLSLAAVAVSGKSMGQMARASSDGEDPDNRSCAWKLTIEEGGSALPKGSPTEACFTDLSWGVGDTGTYEINLNGAVDGLGPVWAQLAATGKKIKRLVLRPQDSSSGVSFEATSVGVTYYSMSSYASEAIHNVSINTATVRYEVAGNSASLKGTAPRAEAD